MIYRSTRSAMQAGACEAILSGIAPDGGLYLPEVFEFPDFDALSTSRKDFFGIAEDVLHALFSDFSREEIDEVRFFELELFRDECNRMRDDFTPNLQRELGDVIKMLKGGAK